MNEVVLRILGAWGQVCFRCIAEALSPSGWNKPDDVATLSIVLRALSKAGLVCEIKPNVWALADSS